MQNVNEEIGERIKLYRQKKGLSQEALAEFANVSANYIGSIERGEKSPSLSTIVSISKALNISVDILLSLDSHANDILNYSFFYDLLSDCSEAENDILLTCMEELKKVLKKYKIKQ